ncbi:MAG: hypothetical protein US51_C0033G0007 [Microgenomates group bacterium GW2011_GWA2_37_6]|nr:MAG: hypothetical protein US51_C0033G0007 [Microgenomates group bacterium GW2011_GWA2_37_6]
MKKEKIILSAVAALIGILVALGAFFFYQSTKEVKPSEIKKIIINNPSPTPESSIFLTVISPKDEEVVDERIITISGKTIPDAKIIVLTQSNEEAGVAARDGSFSTEITLSQNENIIEISAIAPNGEIAKVRRVITYSTESF